MAARRLPAQYHAARRVAATASFALVASTLTGGAVAAADEPVIVEASPICAGAAASAQDAAAMARSCEQDVEIVSERTEWETTFATPAGATRLDISSTAIRTAVNGSWEPIDTSVVPVDGELRVAAPAFEMAFSDGSSDKPLARIVKDDHELTFDVPFELTAPVVEGSQVTYPQVLEGVDLVVSVHEDGTGFSEVLRVDSPQAAANPVLAELSFPVTTSAALAVAQSEGGFEALDDAGAKVFSSPTPLMWDSSTPPFDEQSERIAAQAGSSSRGVVDVPGAEGAWHVDRVAGPLDGDTVLEMPARVGDGAVTVVPDAQMIDDPETQWPVFIDPSVSGGLHERTLIRSGNPDIVAGYNWSGNAGLGLCDPGTDSACSKWNDVHRLIFEYNGLTTIGAMAGSDVISATFSAYGAHSYGCTATGVEAHWVTGITAATTWNNYGNNFSSLLQARSVAHKPECSNARRIEFDVTRLLKGTADGNYSTAVVGLRASNEGSMVGGWKRYRGDATLSVTYNRVPNAGSSPRTDPVTACVTGSTRPFIRTTTPTLFWKVSDPDGGNVVGNLDIVDVATGVSVWDAPYDLTMASGSEFGKEVPSGKLVDGKSYEWRGGGKDVDDGRFGAMTACQFTVDTKRPDKQPTVSAVAGQAGVYVEDVVSGGVGKAGQFQFGTAGVSDVVSYNYSFNGDGMLSTVTVAAGGKVSFTPTSPGSQRLYVQSVDRAGNTSDVRLYRFSVAFPELDGFWRMDEGSGVTSGSSAGSAGSLALSSSVQWVEGPLAEFGYDSSDRALRFDSTADTAQSAGPVVDTSDSYTVSAFVKLERTDDGVAAVSQNGQLVSGFKLGHRVDPACPTGTSSCWAFWAPPVDETTPMVIKSMSTIPVKTGQWVHLTGVRDATAGTLTLWVCELGTPDDPLPAQPVMAAQVPFAATGWSAGGPLQVGRAQTNGAPNDHWPGAIDDVRVYNGEALSKAKIYDLCQKQAA